MGFTSIRRRKRAARWAALSSFHLLSVCSVAVAEELQHEEEHVEDAIQADSEQPKKLSSDEINSRENAIKKLQEIATFFRKTEPHSPMSYTIEQVIRWSELSLPELLNDKTISGELLPTTDRQLNFTLLARDSKGGLATDEVTLNVVNTGAAFAITSPIPRTLQAGQNFDLSWDVAGTNQAPINCDSVDIGFIQSDANYLPILHGTPNDGQETITLPLNAGNSANASVKVACSNNIFFAVSKSQHEVYDQSQTGGGGGSFSLLAILGFFFLLLARLISMLYPAPTRKVI